MVTHMKTTIEIGENLLIRAKARAKEQNITLRALIENSLTIALNTPNPPRELKPVCFKGNGLNPEFETASWDQIRDAIY